MDDENTNKILAAMDSFRKDNSLAHEAILARIDKVQKTADGHEKALKAIAPVIAGKMAVAINNVEGHLDLPKTDFFS